MYKVSKRTNISAKLNLALSHTRAHTHTHGRPGPSPFFFSPRFMLFSPDTRLPREGDRGHEHRMVGLIRKPPPGDQTMTSTAIIIITITASSSADSSTPPSHPPQPPFCVTMATFEVHRAACPRGRSRVRVSGGFHIAAEVKI